MIISFMSITSIKIRIGKRGRESTKMGSCFLHLPLEEYCMETFSLEKAVCNHGFFMMAPNSWIPSTKTLRRPLRLANSTTSVNVSISHPPDNTSIVIQVHDIENVSPEDEKVILVLFSPSLLRMGNVI
jgi:hypothetical protein